ncbi:TetR family transcriptional regulator [Gemmiger formicilis]
MLQQKSLREITVRELTELAGISRGTFYFHYADIYALMESDGGCPAGAAQ